MASKKWTQKEVDEIKFLKTFMTAKRISEDKGLSKNQVTYALYLYADKPPRTTMADIVERVKNPPPVPEKKRGLFRWFPFLGKRG